MKDKKIQMLNNIFGTTPSKKGKILPLKGKRFGEVKVLRRIKKRVHGCRVWECKCKRCGGYFEAKGSLLKQGKIVSCGCYRQSNLDKANRKRRLFEREKQIAHEIGKGKSIIEIGKMFNLSRQRIYAIAARLKQEKMKGRE